MFKRLIHELPFVGSLVTDRGSTGRKVGGVFLLRLVGTAAGFGFNLILARTLGAEGSGAYFLALSFAVVLNVIGRVGMDNVIVRFVADYADAGSWTKVRSTVRSALIIALASSAICSVVLVAAAPWIADQLFGIPRATWLLRIMAIGIIPAGLTVLLGQALKGLGKARQAAWVEAAGISVMNLVLIAPFALQFGILGPGFAYVVANTLMLALGAILWRRSVRKDNVHSELDRSNAGHGKSVSFGRLLRVGVPLLWVASMSLVMKWTDTFMLGIWETPAAIGIYGNAMRTSVLTSFVLIAVNSVIAPRFAALHRRGDNNALGRLARRSALATTLMALPIAIALAAFSRTVMGVFGSEFAAGAPVLTILTIGEFVNVATGSVINVLVMTGRERMVQRAFVVAAIANVLLNAALIPTFGIMGAGVATAVSVAGINVAAAVMVRIELGIWTLPIPFIK